MSDGKSDLEAKILTVVAERGRLKEDELREAACPGGLEEPFSQALEHLIHTGAVLRLKKARIGTPESQGLIRGRLQGNRRGFAFLLQPDGEDLYISAQNLKGALHGDTVLARPTGKGREAEVVRVVDRANDRILGTLEHRAGSWFLNPVDSRLGTQVVVSRRQVPAEEGAACAVRITDFGDGTRPPVGVVVENLGPLEAPGVEVTLIAMRHNLAEAFPKEVLEAAELAARPVRAEDLAGRLDLRGQRIVTIDSADAKDLDDAISLTKNEDGWELGVHIADVGHYVREGDPIDREAERRGTSVYLVDRVIPMLPEPISNGVASLHPDVDRLTLSALVRFDPRGVPKDLRLVESVIRTSARLTYQGVNDALAGHPEGVYRNLLPLLSDMARLRDLLRERRLERGAIDFDLYEDRVKLDLHGRPAEIMRVWRTPADSLIEEFMLAANEAVARLARRRELPFLFRIHEEPDADKVRTLKAFLRRFGIQAKFGDHPTPRLLQRIVEEAKGGRDENIISTVVLRSMMRARYATEPTGHFGLAARDYTHFTSPIRRYPDLVIHRILREALFRGGLTAKRRGYLEAWLQEVARSSSEAEHTAEEAERESVDLKKVEFMAERVGEVHEGIVTGVTAFGLFVEMDVGVEGLVPVATIADDFYVHDEEIFSLVGRRTKRTFRLGDRLKVKVAAVNRRDRRVELVLDEETGEDRKRRRVDASKAPPYNQGTPKAPQGRRKLRTTHEGHRRKPKGAL